MANKRPGRLEQSLLSFPVNACSADPNDVSPGVLDGAFDAHRTAKPPPYLPSELWEMILSTLGNFLIKQFRLVHPQWASIGASYLFQTVYVSVHQHSIAGLIQIAGSTHAVVVQRIIWSPFALWPDCLDPDGWLSTYKHLLKGLKHTKLVELHQIYRRLFRDQKQNQPRDQINDLTTVMGNLVNCCEFIIHDGQKDIESACCDPEFRSAVQRSSSFHRASIWVTRPNLALYSNGVVDDPYGVIDKLIVKSCVQVIGAIENCPIISALKVSCQEWVWDKVTHALVHSSRSRWRDYRMAFAGIRSLCLILERTIDCHHHACSRSPEVFLGSLGSFALPELVDLSVKVVAVKNRILDETSIDGEESDSEPGQNESLYDEPIAGSDSTTQSTLDSLTSDTARRSDGAPDPADVLEPTQHYQMFVQETQLILGTVRFPKLEKLNLGNFLIDTDLLLAWCWLQLRLPQSRLTITMTGFVILDELALDDFTSALSSLNVELIYDSQSTGYFARSEWFQKLSIKNRRLVVHSKRFDDVDGWENYVSEERALHFMPPMAALPNPKPKVLPPHGTEAILGNSRLYYPWVWEYIEIDDQYILDFWEDTQDDTI